MKDYRPAVSDKNSLTLKRSLLSFLFVLFAAFCLVLTGCSDDDDDGPGPNPVGNGSLTGTVTAAEGGVLLKDVSVKVVSGDQTVGTAVTNANGVYYIDSVPAKSVSVIFSLNGFQTLNKSINIVADTENVLDAVMSVTPIGSCYLNGTVTALTDAQETVPLENVIVTMLDENGESIIPIAYTDKEGKYSINCPEGSYTVTYEKKSYVTKEYPIILTGNQTKTQDVLMDVSASIYGYIYYGEAGSVGVPDVTVTLKKGGNVVSTAITSAQGYYYFLNNQTEDSVTYTLEFAKEGFTFNPSSLSPTVSNKTGFEAQPIAAIAPPSTITCRFLDGWSQEDPLPLTTEKLSLDIIDYNNIYRKETITTTTGILETSFGFTKPGTYTFAVTGKYNNEGNYNYKQTFEVTPGQPVTLTDYIIRDRSYIFLKGSVYKATNGALDPEDYENLRIRVYTEDGTTILQHTSSGILDPDSNRYGEKSKLSSSSAYYLTLKEGEPTPGKYKVVVSHIQRKYARYEMEFEITQALLEQRTRPPIEISSAQLVLYTPPYNTVIKGQAKAKSVEEYDIDGTFIKYVVDEGKEYVEFLEERYLIDGITYGISTDKKTLYSYGPEEYVEKNISVTLYLLDGDKNTVNPDGDPSSNPVAAGVILDDEGGFQLLINNTSTTHHLYEGKYNLKFVFSGYQAFESSQEVKDSDTLDLKAITLTPDS